MPKPPREVPDAAALREGLLAALGIYVEEADLSHAAGETGFIHLNVKVMIDSGRVRYTQGGVHFERRIEIAGGRG